MAKEPVTATNTTTFNCRITRSRTRRVAQTGPTASKPPDHPPWHRRRRSLDSGQASSQSIRWATEVSARTTRSSDHRYKLRAMVSMQLPAEPVDPSDSRASAGTSLTAPERMVRTSSHSLSSRWTSKIGRKDLADPQNFAAVPDRIPSRRLVFPTAGHLAKALARSWTSSRSGTDFLLGHNLIKFDLPHLTAAKRPTCGLLRVAGGRHPVAESPRVPAQPLSPLGQALPERATQARAGERSRTRRPDRARRRPRVEVPRTGARVLRSPRHSGADGG